MNIKEYLSEQFQELLSKSNSCCNFSLRYSDTDDIFSVIAEDSQKALEISIQIDLETFVCHTELSQNYGSLDFSFKNLMGDLKYLENIKFEETVLKILEKTKNSYDVDN